MNSVSSLPLIKEKYQTQAPADFWMFFRVSGFCVSCVKLFFELCLFSTWCYGSENFYFCPSCITQLLGLEGDGTLKLPVRARWSCACFFFPVMLLCGLGKGGNVACKFIFSLCGVSNRVVIENTVYFPHPEICCLSCSSEPSSHYKLTFFESSLGVGWWVTLFCLVEPRVCVSAQNMQAAYPRSCKCESPHPSARRHLGSV